MDSAPSWMRSPNRSEAPRTDPAAGVESLAMNAIDALFTKLQRNEAEPSTASSGRRHRILFGVTLP